MPEDCALLRRREGRPVRDGSECQEYVTIFESLSVLTASFTVLDEQFPEITIDLVSWHHLASIIPHSPVVKALGS